MDIEFEERINNGDKEKTKILKLLIEHGYKEHCCTCLRSLYDVAKNAPIFENSNGELLGNFQKQDIENFINEFDTFVENIKDENIERKDILNVIIDNYQLSATSEEVSERVGFKDKDKLYTENSAMLMNMNELPENIIEIIKEKILK